MLPEDPEKLLGGYAAGNLTPEERSRLFESALNDQTLFDALVDDEPLRELLSDPVAKARLRRSLEPAPRAPWFRQRLAWSLAGSFAVTVFVGGFLAWRLTEQKSVSRTEIAQVAAPAAAPTAPAEAPPSESGKVAAVPRAKLSRPASRAVLPPPQTARSGNQPALSEPPPVAQSFSAPAAAPPVADAGAVPKAETRVAGRDSAPAARFADESAAKSETAAQSSVAPPGVNRGVLSARNDIRARAIPALGIRTAEVLDAALPHHVLLRRDSSGAWRPLEPGAPLRTGDALRLRVVSPQAGELQVRVRDIEGVWRPLLEPGVRIDAGAGRTVPAEGEIVLQGEQQISITVTPDAAAPVLERHVTLSPR